jgi:hypothetical protein
VFDQSVSDDNLHPRQKICTQMHQLFQPIPKTSPFVLRAMRSRSASASENGLIQVVPYDQTVDQLVWTDRPTTRFASNSESNKYPHPDGQFNPKTTYYIRSANWDKNTSPSEHQMVLWSNKPVTVFVELWMQKKKPIGVNDWCNAYNGWIKVEQPLARYYTPSYTADELLNLPSGSLFTQGVYMKQFPPGNILLKGNGGNGTGSYYVFVTETPIDQKNVIHTKDQQQKEFYV